MTNADLRDAKDLLGHVAPAIYEAIRELELGADQIDEIAAELRGADSCELSRALGDLGRDLFRHVRALRRAMDVVFEDETD